MFVFRFFFQRNDTRIFVYIQQKLRREKIKRNTIVKNKIPNQIINRNHN